MSGIQTSGIFHPPKRNLCTHGSESTWLNIVNSPSKAFPALRIFRKAAQKKYLLSLSVMTWWYRHKIADNTDSRVCHSCLMCGACSGVSSVEILVHPKMRKSLFDVTCHESNPNEVSYVWIQFVRSWNQANPAVFLISGLTKSLNLLFQQEELGLF